MNKIFNKKAIRIVERYDQNQNIDTSNSFGLYPRNKKQEEMAWAWTKKKDTTYVQDKIFIKNFWYRLYALLEKILKKT